MKCIASLLLLLACAIPAVAQSQPASAPAQVRPRIVSASPLLTDLLFQMGLGDQVVGVTKFCLLPQGVHRDVLSSREKVDTERIVGIRPDIVLIQQNPDDFKPLQRLLPGLKVEFFRIETLADIDQAAVRIATLAGVPQAGERAVGKFHADLDAVRQRVKGLPTKRILFATGVDPMMIAGSGTFHDGMITLAGGVNAAAGNYDGWKKISAEVLLSLQPDVVVCQVFPGQETQTAEFFGKLVSLPAVRNHKVFLVDDPRWTISSMYSAKLTADLAEMAHGHRRGNDLPAPAKGISVYWIAGTVGAVAALLLLGGLLLALAGRRRKPAAPNEVAQ